MSEDIDDIMEFINTAADVSSAKVRRPSSPPSMLQRLEDELEDEKKLRGEPVQYARFGGGYMPTSRTIKSLPSGCYDIQNSDNGPFAVPAIEPSGILLELPEMRSDDVIKVVETFWASEKDYKEGNEFIVGGAAYKAGIMVFGPPGSGKSCTLKIVSKRLVKTGGTVFYASGHPAPVMLFLKQFSQIEKNRKCIVILEDIDSLIQNYGEDGYLEMLDSAKSINNVLFIATTNYPDRLDPRIFNRPGRFSHVMKIGLPTRAARTAFLKAILKNHRDVEQIVNETENFTIDHLSSLISAVYREKKDLQNELKRLRTLFKVPKIVEDTIGINLKGEE